MVPLEQDAKLSDERLYTEGNIWLTLPNDSVTMSQQNYFYKIISKENN